MINMKVEKRQLRKRERVGRLFERNGRATSLAEGFVSHIISSTQILNLERVLDRLKGLPLLISSVELNLESS